MSHIYFIISIATLMSPEFFQLLLIGNSVLLMHMEVQLGKWKNSHFLDKMQILGQKIAQFYLK